MSRSRGTHSLTHSLTHLHAYLLTHSLKLFLLKTESLVNDVHESGLSLGKISVGKILTDILSLCYVHEVKLESRFVAVVLALGIVEGIGRTLDPDLDILHEAGPYVFEACVSL